MPRPSRKRTGDGPTSNDPEDLACQGKLPRGTTIAEDITVAPRSASKISPLKDFDGDGTKARATSSKTDEAKSGKLTRKKRAAPDITPSDKRSGALRSSRKRAGDFNDVDGGEFDSVAIDDTPTEAKSTKPSKKRKTTKSANENPPSVAPADHQVETAKIFPGGDRVEVEPARKRGRKPGKKVEKSEPLPIESAKSSRKATGSKSSEKLLDGGKQPTTSNEKDEVPADVTKDQPKRRGRPKKSQVESKSDVKSAESTALQKLIPADETNQTLPKTGKSKRSTAKEPVTRDPVEKESTSKASTSKAPTPKEPVKDDPVTKKPVTKESIKKEPAKKESAKKELAKKEPAKKEPANKEPANKEPANKEPAKREPAKREPAKREPAKREPAKREPAKKEPTKKEPTKEELPTRESASKEPAKKELAKKEPAKEAPAEEEPTKNEPTTKVSTSKASTSKMSASKVSTSKASASRTSATKKSVIEEAATEEPAAEEHTAEEPITGKPNTTELAATKPAPKPSKRVNKGEQAGKAADVEAPATIKTSRSRKENKATYVAEPSNDGPKVKASKKASDSAKKDDTAKGMRLKSGEVASSSKNIGPAGAETLNQAGNDNVTSEAAISKKRKTPPGADPDAIRKVIDPLTELESSKKKQRKEFPTSLETAKSKIGDLVSPIVDTVNHGIHTAKGLAAEVQSSILEDVAAVAEEAADTEVEEAEIFRESGVPVAKDDKDKHKGESKGKEKEKERVRALSREVEPAQTSAEDLALKGPEVNLGTTKEDVLGNEQNVEMTDQPQTSLTGLDDGTKEPANTDEVAPEEHLRRSYQSTLVEVSGISTVCTTVVQGGQL